MASEFRGKGRGFTLVELMAVVIIIIILLALSLMVPQYSDFRDRITIKGFSTSILTKLREAKNLSKALGKNVNVVVDLDNEKVWISVDKVQYGSALSAPSSKCDIKGFQEWNDAGVTKTTGSCTITYYNRGTSITENMDGPDGIFHIGSTSDVYASGGNNALNMKTIAVLNAPGRAEWFNSGCVGTANWATSWGWPKCKELTN
ncbi:MAG: prepilin-type N-terminal cleavage/methylation domain-containing protein [Candidatus Hydrogenedentota bacterium]